MNKVLGFAPDADPTTPGVLTDCANLIPSELGMRPGPTAAPVGVAATPEDVRGALAAGLQVSWCAPANTALAMRLRLN